MTSLASDLCLQQTKYPVHQFWGSTDFIHHCALCDNWPNFTRHCALSEWPATARPVGVTSNSTNISANRKCQSAKAAEWGNTNSMMGDPTPAGSVQISIMQHVFPATGLLDCCLNLPGITAPSQLPPLTTPNGPLADNWNGYELLSHDQCLGRRVFSEGPRCSSVPVDNLVSSTNISTELKQMQTAVPLSVFM